MYCLGPPPNRVGRGCASSWDALRAEDEFDDHYYAEDPTDEGDDAMWFVRDSLSKDAPHQPVTISYRQSLAHFSQLDDVVPILLSDEYQHLEQCIAQRFLEEQE